MNYIGMILRSEQDIGKRPKMVFPKEIIDNVNVLDVVPIGIFVDFEQNVDVEFNRLKPILDFCSGIIFPGNDCIYEIDFVIARYLRCIQKPTLGICGGMQIMAEAANGVEEEIGNLSHKSELPYVHSVQIHPQSCLGSILGKNEIMVNSRHLFEITKTELFVSARSLDGIIEAVEDHSLPFYIGVEWHPESLSDENSKKLFQAFLFCSKKRIDFLF